MIQAVKSLMNGGGGESDVDLEMNGPLVDKPRMNIPGKYVFYVAEICIAHCHFNCKLTGFFKTNITEINIWSRKRTL